MTLKQYLRFQLPFEMKKYRGKKRLRKKRAKKALITKWKRIQLQRQKRVMQPPADGFMGLVMESAISSAMDALLSIPRKRHPNPRFRTKES